MTFLKMHRNPYFHAHPLHGAFSLIASFLLAGLFLLLSMFVSAYNQWKWMRWPCPRCGCAFRGYWTRPWLPKQCVYCGLPRWSDSPDNATHA